MAILKGQIRNALRVAALRGKIPENLREYIDFRPTATGVTIVSYFEFAPMRGIEKVTDAKAGEVLAALKMKQNFLISPETDEQEKQEFLASLGFRIRKPKSDDYLEEDVQATAIRELLGSDGGLGALADRLAVAAGVKKLRFLTAELEWSGNRIDLLCCDAENHDRIVLVELKKVRTTKLEQGRYVPQLKQHEDELKTFVATLTGVPAGEGRLEIGIWFMMPFADGMNRPALTAATRKHAVNGIVFYRRGFTPIQESISGSN